MLGASGEVRRFMFKVTIVWATWTEYKYLTTEEEARETVRLALVCHAKSATYISL